jgi:hypothetical protein
MPKLTAHKGRIGRGTGGANRGYDLVEVRILDGGMDEFTLLALLALLAVQRTGDTLTCFPTRGTWLECKLI